MARSRPWQGLAFTIPERQMLGIHGLFPPAVESIDTQVREGAQKLVAARARQAIHSTLLTHLHFRHRSSEQWRLCALSRTTWRATCTS